MKNYKVILIGFLIISAVSCNNQNKANSSTSNNKSTIDTVEQNAIINLQKQKIEAFQKTEERVEVIKDSIVITYKNVDLGAVKNKTFKKLSDFEKFKNLKFSGAILMEPYDENFALSHYVEDDTHFIVFEKLSKDVNSTIQHQALDLIKIDGLQEGLWVSYGLCRKNEVFDSEIIAVFVREEKEFYNKIHKAWRADKESGRILEIEKEGIDCINEGYGV